MAFFSLLSLSNNIQVIKVEYWIWHSNLPYKIRYGNNKRLYENPKELNPASVFKEEMKSNKG